MILIATDEKGLYQPEETFLHRLDPRIKVLSCLLLVILAFAATDWAELSLLTVVVLMTLWRTASLVPSVGRVCWMLRWLLLFTLLLHLFFTPGRTLWGTSWLSFDGFLTGSMVSVQMLLAVVVSTLLAATTSTVNLVRAFGWFVLPLHWFGCKTAEWQKLLLLTLDFMPIVHAEMRAPGTDRQSGAAPVADHGLWSAWSQKLQSFLLRLVDRGDNMAHRIAADEKSLELSAVLPSLWPMALNDLVFLSALSLLTVCYWIAG